MTDKETKKAEKAAWDAFAAKRTPAEAAEAMRLIGEGLTRRDVLAQFGRSPGRQSNTSVTPSAEETDQIWARVIDRANARLPNVG